MDLNLTDLRALVTGASRGLGFAVARTLAAEGARVAINSRGGARLDEAAARIASETGRPAFAIPGDVADPALTAGIVNQAAAQLGGLDLLVTNAGGPPPGPFDAHDDAAWERAVHQSFLAHVRLIRAALPTLRQSAHASVLTVASASVKAPIANLVLSNSIRAATASLTKSLSIELGKDGIRFNAILPGWTETERVTELVANRAQTNGTSIQEELDKQARESPLGRLGRPQEFANAAVFLLSPAASYVNGVMLLVDGGSTRSW